MWHADHGDLLHRGMSQQAPPDLDRRDVLTARNDDVLEAVADFDVAVWMPNRGVARMEPVVLDRRARRLGVVVIAFHNDVAADRDLAQRLAVVCHLVAVLVYHFQFTRTDQFDTLARLD